VLQEEECGEGCGAPPLRILFAAARPRGQDPHGATLPAAPLALPQGNVRYRYLVLQIRDVYPGSEFFPFRIRIFFIPDPDPDFYPSRIPDPRVKKAPDPGSETLPVFILNGQSREKFDKYNNNSNESDIVLYDTIHSACALRFFQNFPDIKV
jgi:hypothetical protein